MNKARPLMNQNIRREGEAGGEKKPGEPQTHQHHPSPPQVRPDGAGQAECGVGTNKSRKRKNNKHHKRSAMKNVLEVKINYGEKVKTVRTNKINMTQASILEYTEIRREVTTPDQQTKSNPAANTQQQSDSRSEASELSKHIHTNSTTEQGISNKNRPNKGGGSEKGKGQRKETY